MYKPLLRYLIVIVLHPYLPCYPSQYYLIIMFDLCHCQNIHSHCRNRYFKGWTKFQRKSCHKAFICMRGGGDRQVLLNKTIVFSASLINFQQKISYHLIFQSLSSAKQFDERVFHQITRIRFSEVLLYQRQLS